MNLFSDIDLGVSCSNEIKEVKEEKTLECSRVTIDTLLSRFKSAIGLDISKNSTGVVIWEAGTIKQYRIVIDEEYDDSDVYSEIKMRLAFKKDLLSLVEGKEFEVAVVENVFGGTNFETVRKLLALNTVLDEIVISDKKCVVEHMYKYENTYWKKWLRKVYKVDKAPTDKYEIEQILLYMGYPFAVNNTNLKPSEKAEIGYQDILDATGLLCALSMELGSGVVRKQGKKLRMDNVEIDYIGDLTELDYIEDRIYKRFPIELVNYNGKSLEKFILSTLQESDEDIIYGIQIPYYELGAFAMKYNIIEISEDIVLLFYKKSLKRKKVEV